MYEYLFIHISIHVYVSTKRKSLIKYPYHTISTIFLLLNCCKSVPKSSKTNPVETLFHWAYGVCVQLFWGQFTCQKHKKSNWLRLFFSFYKDVMCSSLVFSISTANRQGTLQTKTWFLENGVSSYSSHFFYS